MSAAVGAGRAGAVQGDEIGERRPVGGLGAEPEEAEVAGGDSRDREDRRPGQGLGAREAGQSGGREGVRGKRRRERGFAVFSFSFELVVRAVVVVIVLGERSAFCPRFPSASAEAAAARQEAAAAAAGPRAAAAAAEQLAGASVPGAGCF